MPEGDIRPLSVPLAPPGAASQPLAGGAPETPPGKSFREILEGALSEANRMQVEAQDAMQRLATGETMNKAEVIAAVRQAELAFNLMMEIRNKLVDAYQEISRMRL